MNGRRKRKTLAGRDQWYAGGYRKEDPQSESLETETHRENKSSAARVRGATARPVRGKAEQAEMKTHEYVVTPKSGLNTRSCYYQNNKAGYIGGGGQRGVWKWKIGEVD